MTYNRRLIYNQAKEAIVKHKLFFIEDIIAFLPISSSTFYAWEMEKSEELKELLQTNRVELKVSMRSKWYKSNAPALQMALMKLIASPDELRKLSMNHQVTEEAEKPIFNPIDLDVTEDNGAEENS
jgi:hypothetical protein